MQPTRIKEVGAITAANSAVTAVVPFLNSAACSAQISGTWSGACVIEATVDNTNWVAFAYINCTSGATETSISANGVYRTELVGVSMVRVRRSTATSGTANVTLAVQGN